MNGRPIGSDTIDVFPTQPGRFWLQTELRGAPVNAEKRFGAICLVVTLALTANPQPALRAQTPVRGVELSSHAATVMGTVVDGDDRQVGGARVRLRDVTSGRIVMTTRGNESGEFRFVGVPSGSYLVEFVEEQGDARGVSQTFAIKPAETLSTTVRIGVRRPWYSGFFSNAALAAVSSAAALGVTAVGNGMQPASGRF